METHHPVRIDLLGVDATMADADAALRAAWRDVFG